MLQQRKMIERNICSEPIRPSTTLWEDLKSSLIMLMPGTTLIPIEDFGHVRKEAPLTETIAAIIQKLPYSQVLQC
jgi:hypothetical protein